MVAILFALNGIYFTNHHVFFFLDIPYAQLQKGKLEQQLKEPVYVVCRYGNDSQGSVKEIKKLTGLKQVFDIRGGLDKWALEIDNTFPRY